MHSSHLGEGVEHETHPPVIQSVQSLFCQVEVLLGQEKGHLADVYLVHESHEVVLEQLVRVERDLFEGVITGQQNAPRAGSVELHLVLEAVRVVLGRASVSMRDDPAGPVQAQDPDTGRT